MQYLKRLTTVLQVCLPKPSRRHNQLSNLDVILFWQFPLTLDEFLHGDGSIRSLISLAFHSYVECPKRSTYATWATILVCAAPNFRIWIEVGVDDDLKLDEGNVMGVSTTVLSSSVKYLFYDRIVQSFGLSSNWYSKDMSSGGIVPTRFWSWIQRVVSIGALRGRVFSNRTELYGSNQNSSADRLGLNPAGLTK